MSQQLKFTTPPEFDEILKIYHRRAKRLGHIIMMPSQTWSDVDNNYWYLNNGSETLAVYNWRTRRFVNPKLIDSPLILNG
jgi:hypothetical protein